jgi:hypothetical protein
MKLPAFSNAAVHTNEAISGPPNGDKYRSRAALKFTIALIALRLKFTRWQLRARLSEAWRA